MKNSPKWPRLQIFHRFNISHNTLFYNYVKITKCQITGKLLISALWIHKNRENDQFLPSFWPWCGQHDQDNSGYIITNIIKTYFRSSLTPKSAMNRVSFGGNKDFKAIRISVVYLNYIKNLYNWCHTELSQDGGKALQHHLFNMHLNQ